ncbi:hypothetical protein [Arenicella xantha]|uniref:Uncharacterized protein n=1 Tax=Arenicella xantha TaxID=644221 RepID=A0A395JNC2_9GAMM|nr:hypothetical protein [Arenicella xantha]RBP52977.1 hypothetical protein DFR28_101361 [Arenicella xantha]
MNQPFQRIGSKSNSQVGSDFEKAALAWFEAQKINLVRNFKVPVGVNENKKVHAFDLGCAEQRIIVECKSHRWTSGRNVPSAKLTVWNEAMYYFMSAPKGYRKIMFVLKDYSAKRNESLAEYYLRRYSHLVPDDVEFCEFDEETRVGSFLKHRF